MELLKVDTEVSITLKELTDLISVRHNDSMRKVEELSAELTFGTLRKTRIVYNDKGQEIDTYLLTKKQAIAAGARLNNSLLMLVIDKLEDMEKSKNKPMTIEQLLQENIRVIGQLQTKVITLQTKVITLQNKVEEDKPKVKFAEAISGTTSNIDFETFGKVLYDSEGIKMGRNNLMKWFRNNGYLTKNNKPYQTMLDRGLMTLKEGNYITQATQELVTYIQPRITGKGQMYFTNKLLDEVK